MILRGLPGDFVLRQPGSIVLRAGREPANVGGKAGRRALGVGPLGVNLRRLHQSPGQLATLALALEPHFAAEAKEAQRDGGGAAWRPVEQASDQGELLVADSPQATSDERKARERAARAVGASGRNVSTAKAIRRDAPDLWPGESGSRRSARSNATRRTRVTRTCRQGRRRVRSRRVAGQCAGSGGQGPGRIVQAQGHGGPPGIRPPPWRDVLTIPWLRPVIRAGPLERRDGRAEAGQRACA